MPGYLSLLLISSTILNFTCDAQALGDTTIIVYFNSGQFVPVQSESKKISVILNGTHFIVKKISGYTDSVGSAEKNIILSKKRSEYIAGLLKRNFNVQENYKVDYFGEKEPASLRDNAMNRRVEIYLQPMNQGQQITDSDKFSIFQTLTLDKIYFRPDEPIIEPASMPYLDHVAEILKAFKTEHFEIRGHVNWNDPINSNSDSGYKKKMDQLSTDRAKAVYDILIDRGIEPERMTWMGMGNTQMIYPYAETDEEKRKNMRVEILILRKSE